MGLQQSSIVNRKSKIRSSGKLPATFPTLLEEAKRYLVGGVNSPVRSFGKVGGEPVIAKQGKGAYLVDASGRRYIDLIMGWGALILGHAHPTVLRAIRHQVATGTSLGLTHQTEVELAKAITEAFPSIDQVRFMTSGTEACMLAIRLARACTGRSKILTFEGCYHGHSDGLLVSHRTGVPEALAQETITVPYNDVEALDERFRRFGDSIACAIVEPVAANMGVIVPELTFLRRLRDLTTRHKALLVFDEVVTGFRVAYGGAQTLFRLTPDVTVLGKIIGGGLPVGAVGGPRHLMEGLAPEGPVYHAGTFAGHPVAMAAGLATLTVLKQEPPYERLESLGARLATGLLEAAERARVAIQVNRLGSMATVFFNAQPVTQFASVQQTQTRQFASVANHLRKAGVLIPPSPFEAMFLSAAHTQDMIDRMIEVAADAFAQLS